MSRKTDRQQRNAVKLTHRTHIREFDHSCEVCSSFIIGEISEDEWAERTGMNALERSLWQRFTGAVWFGLTCEDVIIPGYGCRGVHRVIRGCGCSGAKHTISGCTVHKSCLRGYDSPMA